MTQGVSQAYWLLATESNLVRLKQEGGFIQKEVRWPTDSLGRMGKAGTETKRPDHSWPQANHSSRSQCSEDNATAALARALTSGAPGSEFCCCSCCPQPLVTSRDVPCPCSVAFLFLYGWGAWRLTSLGRSPRSLAARDAGTTPIHHSRSTLGG